jgi:hypothetical protein
MKRGLAASTSSLLDNAAESGVMSTWLRSRRRGLVPAIYMLTCQEDGMRVSRQNAISGRKPTCHY